MNPDRLLQEQKKKENLMEKITSLEDFKKFQYELSCLRLAMTTEEQQQADFLQKKLRDKAGECNLEANKQWRNDRIYSVDVTAVVGDYLLIELSVGKFESTYYSIVYDMNNQESLIYRMSDRITDTAEDIIHYFITPLIFGDDTHGK